MKNSKLNWLLVVLIIVFNFGCTVMSPEVGFGKLASSDDSLTLESNISVINASNSNASLILKGLCESNMNLKLYAKEYHSFKCENLEYLTELSASIFPDGEIIISIESLDDAKNRMGIKEIKIVKDTVLPVVSITGPAAIGGETTIPLSGSCSENGISVQINELNSATVKTTTCENTVWSFNYTFPGISPQMSFVFTATQIDGAQNKTITNNHIVTRVLLADFSIVGVRYTATESYSNLLRSTAGNVEMSWTASAGADYYDVKIEEINSSTGMVGASVCSFNNVKTLSLTKTVASECLMVPGQRFKLTVDAKDLFGGGLTKTFLFRSKAPPSLQSDAGILYINSDLEGTPTPTQIFYSSFVLDPDSTGPFTVSIVSSGGLTTQLSVDNSSATRSLTVAPDSSTKPSGIYNIQIRITDPDGGVSSIIPLKIAIVFPFSWAGLVDNDFNNKLNWCGVAGLKTGCPGVGTSIPTTAMVMIDSLCQQPIPAGIPSPNCAPGLSSNTFIRSMYLKSNSFDQNASTLNLGYPLDSGGGYLKMTGGTFNTNSSTGDLTVYRFFEILGGMFTAPLNSKVTVNTETTQQGSDSFKIAGIGNFIHNRSSITFVDPRGGALVQYIVIPDGLHVYNFVINSNGARWKLKYNELIVDGDMELGGAPDSSGNLPYLDIYDSNAKFTLNGNLKCNGRFGGGNASVYLASLTPTYRVTTAGCKFPRLNVNNAGTAVSEDAGSTQNLILQGLTLSAGTFRAPVPPREMIFKTVGLDDNSTVADLVTGFLPNSGSVVFETGDDAKNYKIYLSNLNTLSFSNPDSKLSYYDLRTDVSVINFNLLGSNLIPLRGASKKITANTINLATGLINDPSRLGKLILSNAGASDLFVTSLSSISIPTIEIQRPASVVGSSVYYFEGTTFILNFDLTTPVGSDFRYLSKSGVGLLMGGNFLSGQ